MFFGYPVAATAENWLHSCLVEMLGVVHADLQNGTTTPWPQIIPEEFREKLRRRTGLRDRLAVYRAAVAGLTPALRQQVAIGLAQQNRIGELCAGTQVCETVDQLPEPCRTPIAALFEFAFLLLTDLGVRDRQYLSIFQAARYHICPFCGCEYFDAPGAPREDVDHYLPKMRYPFAAANLRNLVPMGMRCNERYKLALDILRRADGARRRAFDPYVDRTIAVRLSGSVPFAGDDGQTPRWVIDFDPDTPECTTWDDAFRLRERLGRDVLDTSFRRWLQEFVHWFRRRVPHAAPDVALVHAAMLEYADDMALLGMNAREFLREPLFRMLHMHCVNGNARLSMLMRDLVALAA